MPGKDQRMTDRERAARLATEVSTLFDYEMGLHYTERMSTTQWVKIMGKLHALCLAELKRQRSCINNNKKRSKT